MMWKFVTDKKNSSFRDAYVNTLDEIMEKDKNVVVLEADLMNSSSTSSLFKKYPEQCVNFGISEANMISAAGGMSKAGLLPFAHSFAPFITRRVLDQIYMSIAYSKNNLFIYSSDAGIWAQRNGGTHTANEDIAVLSSVPNCKVFDPSDPIQFSWLMKNYIKNKGLYYVRSGRKATIPHIYDENSEFEIGKGIVLHKGTSEIAIIASGMMVHESLEAAKILKQKNINVSIIDMFSIKPYDVELLHDIFKENKMIIVAENHSRIGGLGTIVAYEMAKSEYRPVFKHISIPDTFGEVGSLDYLKNKFKLNASDIVDCILDERK